LKSFKFLTLCFLTAILLAACGTTSNQQPNATDEQSDVNNEENNDVSKKPEELPDKEDDKSQDEKIRVMELNIAYEQNGEQKEETAFLKESDNQHYSMYVLPDFELTGEEPGRDVLYFKKDDSIFMRIELLPSDSSIENEIETAKSQLESVSSNISEVKTVDGNDWLKDASIYTAENEKEKVSCYLIPQKNQLLKLSIFTPSKEQAEDPFLKMAETIEK